MDEFELDTELHETLKAIRESVRKLFEQLRLKTETGDASGKDRLERVPALAKRNFGNLVNPEPLLAVKEAWRLVDFLEGGKEARLSPRAREALRAIELDKQLATLRASDRWKEAAARLRETLGTPREDVQPTRLTQGAGEIDPGHPVTSGSEMPYERPVGYLPDLEEAGTEPDSLAGKLRRPTIIKLIGMMISFAVVILASIWWIGKSPDPRYSCVAIETASQSALAAHWDIEPGTPMPRPSMRADARRRVFPISDPSSGGPVRSIWTTSIFSYAERTTRQRPGGGKSDFRLRVGGWGDTYLSLLQVPVPTNRLVQRAVIQLTVLGDQPGSRPTTMTLRAIGDNWQVAPGPNNRLWWRDCPRSEVVRNHLPPPGARDSVYEIEITDLYNKWALGQVSPYGIILEPEQIGSWGPGRPHYANFNTFYSTRALDVANRPRLVLTF